MNDWLAKFLRRIFSCLGRWLQWFDFDSTAIRSPTHIRLQFDGATTIRRLRHLCVCVGGGGRGAAALRPK